MKKRVKIYIKPNEPWCLCWLISGHGPSEECEYIKPYSSDLINAIVPPSTRLCMLCSGSWQASVALMAPSSGLMRACLRPHTRQVPLIRAQIEPLVQAPGAAGITLFYTLAHLWSLPIVQHC